MSWWVTNRMSQASFFELIMRRSLRLLMPQRMMCELNSIATDSWQHVHARSRSSWSEWLAVTYLPFLPSEGNLERSTLRRFRKLPPGRRILWSFFDSISRYACKGIGGSTDRIESSLCVHGESSNSVSQSSRFHREIRLGCIALYLVYQCRSIN
jgi:hypothetical protein